MNPLIQFRRVIQRSEAEAFAKENGLLYIEASAKTAEGVDSAFIDTAKDVMIKNKAKGNTEEVILFLLS